MRAYTTRRDTIDIDVGEAKVPVKQQRSQIVTAERMGQSNCKPRLTNTAFARRNGNNIHCVR